MSAGVSAGMSAGVSAGRSSWAKIFSTIARRTVKELSTRLSSDSKIKLPGAREVSARTLNTWSPVWLAASTMSATAGSSSGLTRMVMRRATSILATAASNNPANRAARCPESS